MNKIKHETLTSCISNGGGCSVFEHSTSLQTSSWVDSEVRRSRQQKHTAIRYRAFYNDLMYKANTRMVDIALDSKAYIKSAFGATSPQYKQVSKLKFTSTR